MLQVFNSNRRNSRRYRFASYKLSDAKVRAAYNEFVVERVAPQWDKDMSVMNKWNVLCDRFVDAGNELLGRDCRCQPDWYKDSACTLQPLITSRNALFTRWLQSQCHRDYLRYAEMRRTVSAAVRKAKND